MAIELISMKRGIMVYEDGKGIIHPLDTNGVLWGMRHKDNLICWVPVKTPIREYMCSGCSSAFMVFNTADKCPNCNSTELTYLVTLNGENDPIPVPPE